MPLAFLKTLEELPTDGIDLMIVMGTALAVAPFNHVVNFVDCPQVLINLENTKASGYDFDDQEKRPHRLFW